MGHQTCKKPSAV